MNSQCIIFVADTTVLKRCGDNSGFIWNPKGFVYMGKKPYTLEPNEHITIIPLQPDGRPWKVYRGLKVDGQFMVSPEGQNRAIQVENMWLSADITITEGENLENLLDRWGVNHQEIVLTEEELQERFNHLKHDDDDDEESLACPNSCCQVTCITLD
jgi:hypothetical protein